MLSSPEALAAPAHQATSRSSHRPSSLLQEDRAKSPIRTLALSPRYVRYIHADPFWSTFLAKPLFYHSQGAGVTLAISSALATFSQRS